MPSKRLNVPLSGARPSPKEPPLSIAGVNPLRVPPSAAAVAIAAVSHLTDSHPPQTTPLRAPLRSALANHCPALAPLVLTRRSLRLPPRAAALRPTRSEATPAARSAGLRACESQRPLRAPQGYALANQAAAACLLAPAPRAIERGHFVWSLSLRLATLASARCSCRSSIESSRPVRARNFLASAV